MSISPITAISSGPKTGAVTQASLNYDAFLKLLVTEMKNQDPSKPMDPTQTVTQLATFSQVEQAVSTNSKLDTILARSAIAQAGSLVGKHISFQDGEAGKIISVTADSAGLSVTLDTGTTVSLDGNATVSA